MKYTEKGITFVNVKQPNTIIPDVIGRQDRLTIDGDNVSNIDNEKTLINAIDIDWNGAQLDNDQINTTADLLNYIKNKTSGSGGGSSQSNVPSYTTSCYRWYMEGHTPQSIIAKPSGNQIDIFNPDANLSDRIYCIPENYWSKNAPNRPQGDYILWQSQAEVRLINGVWTIESWSDPFQISGINGTAGEDLSDREFIYKLFTTKHDWSTDNSNLNPEVWPATDDSDYAGPLIDGVRAWKDNPEGVDDTNRYEYESQRTFKNGHWTKFCRPYLRSCFGRNGMDGDGVEYVYIRTEGNTQPTVSQNQDSTLQEQLGDEYKPYVDYVDENSQTHRERCTDDPAGINSTYKYEWVLKRKKTNPDSVTGKRQWQAYSGQMALWAKYSEDGDKVEVKNGQLYINGEPQNITVEGQGGGGIAVGNITQQDITNNTNNNNYILGRYNGQLYVWTGSSWVSLGESNGSGAYGHIAYADSVTTSVVNGKTVVTSISGFTVDSGNTSKKWIGICIDDNESDPGSDLTQTEPYTYTNTNITNGSSIQIELSKYKWQYVAGKDGNGFEFIYCLTQSGVTPGISNEYKTGPNGEVYPKVKIGNDIITSSNNSNRIHSGQLDQDETYYWTDDPVADVSEQYQILWWANRRFINGEWKNFRGPSKIDEWTEGITTSPVPFYKWNTGGAPSAPSNPTSGQNYVTVAENAGWSLSIAITNPDPTNAQCKLYCCIAILENSVFKEWSSVIEVDSPNIIQPADGVSPYQLTCYPSAISVRANPLTGDFIDKEYNIGCSLIQGSENKTGNHTGYYVYYKKLYTEVNESWQNLSTVNNGYYNVTFKTDFKTSSSYNSATGISQEYSNNGTTYGYLIGIEFCLSSANTGDTVSASNTLASITVPITCDGRKGVGGGSDGNDGYTREIIKLYKKTTVDLTDANTLNYRKVPKDNIYFDFSTNKLYLKDSQSDIYTITSEFLDKNYTQTEKFYYNKDDCPGDGDTYVITALASTRDINTKVKIEPNQWSAPSLYTDSLNTAIISLYKRSSTNLVGTNIYVALGTDKYEYNFSQKKLSKYDSNTATYISDQSNSIWNGWTTYIPDGTDPCYITQATACSSNNIDYIEISEFSSISLYVKNGQNGENGINGQDGAKGDTGKMFFSMGVWNENTKYVQDTLKIPMVFYDNGEWNESLGCYGSYYYLNPEYTSPSGVQGINTKPTGSQSKFDNNTKDIWIKATNYGLVMTQGIFAEFAKFGSAIISGDYMFSTKGKFGNDNNNNNIDSAQYKIGNGYTAPSTNGGLYPLYTFFDFREPYVVITKEFTGRKIRYNQFESLEAIINEGINSSSSEYFKLDIKHNWWINIYIKYISAYNSTSSPTSAKVYISDGKDEHGEYSYYTTEFEVDDSYYQKLLYDSDVSGLGSWEGDDNYSIIISQSSFPNPNVKLKLGTNFCQYVNCDIKLEIIKKNFYPNWAVDLKSGEMIAGQGKFKVDALGNVSIKGNIESGSNISGSTITGGIIKADNFYRNVYINGKSETSSLLCTREPTQVEKMLFQFHQGNGEYRDLKTNEIRYPFEYKEGTYYRRDVDSEKVRDYIKWWYENCNECSIEYCPPQNSRYPFGTYDESIDYTTYDPFSDPNFDINNSLWSSGWTQVDYDQDGQVASLGEPFYRSELSKTINYSGVSVTYNITLYLEQKTWTDNGQNYERMPFFLECTGNADIIIVPPSTNNTSDIRIMLPVPDHFPNKIVEVQDYRYKNDQYVDGNTETHLGILTVSSLQEHMALAFHDNQNRHYVSLNNASDREGRTSSFISYKLTLGNRTGYFWVKLSNFNDKSIS